MVAKFRVFGKPRSKRQLLRQQYLVRLRTYKLVMRMTMLERLNYEQEKSALARGDYFPPHHLETHTPNQGCLFCRLELAEIVLSRRNEC